MDIDSSNFGAQLPSILKAISSSRFISLDLELSGIPSRQAGKTRDRLRDEGGKQNLQERYAETKAAAERFQILQLGLTCVEEDIERGCYVMRPYNFYLSPMIERRLKVERDFSYQSGAVEFLMAHNFKMDAPFLQGIRYLSWQEEAQARTTATAEWSRETIADISISRDDTENLQLMARVREEISIWRQRTSQEPSFLNIAPPGNRHPGSSERGLNAYQKRLVHQLIRAEYPDLVSITKFDFVQLIPYDKEREEAQTVRRRQGLERNLVQQIGLRWLIEVLCLNIEQVLPREHISPISTTAALESMMVARSVPGNASAAPTSENLQSLLAKEMTLVGHNIFLDLVYLYACFFGDLPEKVEEFQSKMGILFPCVIDTKYLADIINQNSPRYRSSLEEIDEELSRIPGPTIEIPPEFGKYAATSPTHEAGFDSFATARILTRLAAKIDGQFVVIAEDGLEAIQVERAFLVNENMLSDMHPDQSLTPSSKHLDVPASANQEAFQSSFSVNSHNPFMTLDLEEPRSSSPQTTTQLMMPSSDRVFWHTYGNKLRVNGTIEEVCSLGPSLIRQSSADSL